MCHLHLTIALFARPPVRAGLTQDEGSQIIQTVTLSLFRFDRLSTRLWALAMMGAARPGLARTPGLDFFKLCGAGVGEGFTPRLDMGIVGILCVWRDGDAAARALSEAPLFARYRARSRESWTVSMAALSSRGLWSGRSPFSVSDDASTPGPLAVLTRATLRPRALSDFWARTPDVSAAIGLDPAVALKIGMGEVPFLQQITFSIWPDRETMIAFARGAGPHAEAVRAVREGRWFREELYARFAILGDSGTWEGRRPLAALNAARAA